MKPKKSSKPKTSEPPKARPARNNSQGAKPIPLPASPDPNAPIGIVGIGASAGGLDALEKLFAAMPPVSGLAFIIVQHLDPRHESLMGELVGKHTKMPVTKAGHQMRVEADHVYVNPPGKSLLINNGVLYLDDQDAVPGVRHPIDAFLSSLAEDQGKRAIAIILSGTGSDGSAGIGDVRHDGGFTLVQDPEEAAFDAMPRNAIATGPINKVARVAEMPAALLKHAAKFHGGSVEHRTPAQASTDTFNAIMALLKVQKHLSFQAYKNPTLMRRIHRRMALRHVKDQAEYLSLLRSDQDELSALFNDFLIGVTGFFRDPHAWEVLQKKVIEPLVAESREDSPIRVWVCGCGTGQEAYSVAMELIEQAEAAQKPPNLQVFASDVSPESLEFARKGLYPSSIASEISPERLARFFRAEGEQFRVQEQLRDVILFSQHNILVNPPFSRLDLICCRNLLIYLEAAAHQKIFALFHFALLPGRYLFLGNAETIGNQAGLFEIVSAKDQIYRKTGVTTPATPGYRAPWDHRTSASAPGHPVTSMGTKFGAIAQSLVLNRFALACAVINRKCEILYLFGPTQDYLLQPTGQMSADLLVWVRGELRQRLRTALREAIKEDRPVTIPGTRIKIHGAQRLVECVIEPVRSPEAAQGLLLVAFRDVSAIPQGKESPPDLSPDEASSDSQMENELKIAQEELRATTEQLECSTEEFHATNEEMLSMNEELHAANEELETSKEELQSVNEELTTLNAQLDSKNRELSRLNDELNSTLNCTEIPMLFLDSQLRIKRFTPFMNRFVDFIQGDLGRPILDLTTKFPDGRMVSDAVAVMTDLSPREEMVTTADGRSYQRRTVACRTPDNRIDGVAISFWDVTERQNHTLAEARIAESVIETILRPILVLDSELKVVFANGAFYEKLQLTSDEIVGRKVREVFSAKGWDFAGFPQLLKTVLNQKQVREGYAMEIELEQRGRRKFHVYGRQISRPGNLPNLILLALDDVTEREMLIHKLTTYQEEEQHRISRELHDGLAQDLTGMTLGLNLLRKSLSGNRQASTKLAKLIKTAQTMEKQVTNLAVELRPASLSQFGLTAALRSYLNVWASNTGIKVSFQGNEWDEVRFPAVVEVTLYRIVQEAFKNIARHANATHVSVVATLHEQIIHVTIEDNGKGFDVVQTTKPKAVPLHLGLFGMKERAALMGGTVEFESRPGKGSSIFIRVPRAGEEHDRWHS